MCDVDVIYAFYGCAVYGDFCDGFKLWSVLYEARFGCVKRVPLTLALV
jgi:hypothetical protein